MPVLAICPEGGGRKVRIAARQNYFVVWWGTAAAVESRVSVAVQVSVKGVAVLMVNDGERLETIMFLGKKGLGNKMIKRKGRIYAICSYRLKGK